MALEKTCKKRSGIVIGQLNDSLLQPNFSVTAHDLELYLLIDAPAWQGTQHLESTIKRGLAWSRSTLFHQRGSALADSLKLNFKATKLLRAQFGEYSLHLPGMLSKG